MGFPQHNASFDDLDEARRFVRKVLGDQDRAAVSIGRLHIATRSRT